jgi:hypothetical protein
VALQSLILDPKAVYKVKKGVGYPPTLVDEDSVQSLAVRAKWLYEAYIARVRSEEEKKLDPLPFPFRHLQK